MSSRQLSAVGVGTVGVGTVALHRQGGGFDSSLWSVCVEFVLLPLVVGLIGIAYGA